jgi:RHS repeat-associated protein
MFRFAPTTNSALPHAVMSISGSTLSTTYSYDPNGNQTAGLGRNVTWTSYNMPASITQGTLTVSFQHDDNHQRIAQVTPSGTTLYINAFGVSAELFGAGTSAASWTDYLSVGNARVGMRVLNVTAQTVSTRYFHTDHLGSVSVITDENAVVQERLSYDAWGKRRFASGADDPTGSITSQTTRGFTGEEELGTVGLVHLNGRVYDPMVGRMISADPTVPDPMNAQAWNRYSYVGNDPLTFTDPSGFSWLSSFFRSVSNFLTSNPIVRAVLQIAVTVALTLTGVGAVVAAAAGAAIVTGLSGGNLGQVLRAAVVAGATAAAFFEVGELTPGAANAMENPAAYAENVAGHALVGCASSAASGGSCESGALSGAISAAAGPLINGQSYGVALAEHAIIGGLASVAGGGKFANGAITAAFGYMFNDAAHNCLTHCDANGAERGISDPTSPWLETAAIAGTVGRGLVTLYNVYGWFSSSDESPQINFQTAHAENHLEGTGLSAEEVERPIREQILSQSGPSTDFSGAFRGTVSVQGQTLEYRAYGLPDGRINVGTYFPVNR